MLDSLIKSAGNSIREFAEMERLFLPEHKNLRQLVFYAERDIYLRYYEDYIQYILTNSDLDICYLSSDPNDPVFASANPRIKPFFIKNLLSAVFSRLDSKVLVMTSPDIDKGSIKRAPYPVHHVYAFHGISSIHQGYRKGALDNYDSLLCIAPYQIAELRKMEEIYGLPKKNLILTGYPLVERIYRDHQIYKASRANQPASVPICLVAPTWDPAGRASIMDCCIYELLEPLSKTEYEVWLRPHPEFVKRNQKTVDAVRRAIGKYPNIKLSLELSSMQCLHEADILVTDHSTIAVDYVLGTERPVLYIDTPTRVDNEDCSKLGMEPVENILRQDLGTCLALTEIGDVGKSLASLLASKEEFKKGVASLRNQLVANWQQADRIGGQYIIDLCKKNEPQPIS
jgi:YidC/Oxa1 family membrane protein insertase